MQIAVYAPQVIQTTVRNESTRVNIYSWMGLRNMLRGKQQGIYQLLLFTESLIALTRV